MALTKSEIDILRFVQKRAAPATPRDFIEENAGYDGSHTIAVRLAMKRLEEQGWLKSHEVDKRIKSFSLNKSIKGVDFNSIKAV